MTIKQALIWATQKLQTKKIKTASLDAEVLLSFIIKKPKEFLYAHPEKILTLRPLDSARGRQVQRFKELINRRLNGEPVAYLTNHQEFYGLDFYVDKRVLIPRPETELLVEEVLNYAYKLLPTSYKLIIADIGTGSGCIAITLKKYLPKAKIYATEISQPALAVAKKNTRKHKVKIKFLHGDLLDPFRRRRSDVTSPSFPRLDVIVANLPYLKNPLPFEPKKALAGGKYGLAVYERFFQQIGKIYTKQRREYIFSPLTIFCEIDPRYLKPLKKLIKKYLPSSQITIKKDLAGLNRILIIRKKAH